MERPVVHLVDDDASFLRSVSRLLGRSGYEVATHPSVDAFLLREAPERAGCVITDLQMPKRSGLDLQEALARTRHPLPVIFLTAKGDIPTTVRAIRGGAEDFLTKRTPHARIVAAIERALERDRRERAERTAREQARARFDNLTTREWQVLRGLLRGLLNKQAADELGIALRTVKHHRTMLMQKLGAGSITELVALAREAGVSEGADGGAAA